MGFPFQPFSEKQLDVIMNADAYINILEGAVRSGKTIASQIAWIDFVQNSPHKKFLMSGVTVDTLFSNVIEDIINIYGKKTARFVKSKSGGATLIMKFPHPDNPRKRITKWCICRGAEKEDTEKKIRGATYGGWYADEITLHHEKFVKQAINRCSLSGRRIFWTTNPDSPYHYIKTDFIDQAELKGFKVWKFEMDDNLSLDVEYKEQLKKTYSGLWYKRMIQGLWVLAEGSIYDMFKESEHVKPTVKRRYSKFYASIDYGTQNPFTIGLWGECIKDGIWYKVKEFHYDGRKTTIQKTDEEYHEDLVEFVGKIPIEEVIIDPSASSFIATIKKKAKFRVRKAKNEVLEGIRNVSSALKNGLIKYNDCCVQTFREFNTYIWDEKAVARGKDEPKKDNDHHMDGDRYFVNTIIFGKTKLKAVNSL